MLPKNRKLRYVKDRASNAYWLLKQGDFKRFLERLTGEVEFQLGSVRDRVITYAEARSQGQLSLQSQPSQEAPAAVPDLDSEYIDRRKILPPSYRPTQFKRVAPVAMQADAEEVKAELRAILSSFNVRERG
ncbi:MAG: hypothetical protein KDI17_14045 [Halioglobus sp.]|nr:hypothetical protein [Halioglobus sp.]